MGGVQEDKAKEHCGSCLQRILFKHHAVQVFQVHYQRFGVISEGSHLSSQGQTAVNMLGLGLPPILHGGQ